MDLLATFFGVPTHRLLVMPRTQPPSRAGKGTPSTRKRNPPPNTCQQLTRARGSESPLRQRDRLGQIPAWLTDPPGPVRGPGLRGAEKVPEVHDPHIFRRRVWERVRPHEPEHLRCTLQQPPKQPLEKRPIALRVQRSKPHLPVEPRVVRSYQRRPSQRVSWLPLELVGLPADPVRAPFHDQLGPFGGHDSKQPISIDGS